MYRDSLFYMHIALYICYAMLLKPQKIVYLIFIVDTNLQKMIFLCLRLKNCIYTVHTETI